MQPTLLLHKLLDGTIHKARQKGLIRAVEAAFQSHQLQLTALGRAIAPMSSSQKSIQERSGVRALDRLLANAHLLDEVPSIYQQVCHELLKKMTRPIILVDWSKYPNSNEYILRAALPFAGRSLTLYETIHPKKYDHHPKAHNAFLEALKALLPDGCKPIIVTDAGFKNPWFKAILKQGWDYIGRVRGQQHFSPEKKGDFNPCKTLHAKATYQMQYLGEMTLTKKNALQTHFYIMKKKPKGRKKLDRSGKPSKHKDSLAHARAAKEPWVLVASLHTIPSDIQAAYAKRMHIEEGFRDMKSRAYGLGLETSYTKQSNRRKILLLIHMLATLIASLTGAIAEQKGIHRHYQVQSTKDKRKLSLPFLGLRLLRKHLRLPWCLRLALLHPFIAQDGGFLCP